MRAVVTGCAGFLGSHLSERLLGEGHEVVGVDCFTDYYPRARKELNMAPFADHPSFEFRELDLAGDPLDGLLDGVGVVYHLAAQPGVRTSFGAGFGTYLRHNVHATQRLMEEAVDKPLDAFVYASSSSVYGDAERYPSAETDAPRPVSPYGMSKVATEQIAGVYHRTGGVPVVGLRYFTVYGPRQRPDMAFSRFLTGALNDEPVPLYGDGSQLRDFTYVADAISGTVAAAEQGRPGSVYNLGGGESVSMTEVIELLGELLERPVRLHREAATRGDARRTSADGRRAREELGYQPETAIAEGIAAQLEWTAAAAVTPDLSTAGS
jgi:UDP-glucuronate 4-epimerase